MPWFGRLQSGVTPWLRCRRTMPEHVRAALALGRGVYVLCFHLGNWEAMGAKCTRCLTPSYVLVKKVGDTKLEADYGNYKDPDLSDIPFPFHIVQRLGGFPILDVTVKKKGSTEARTSHMPIIVQK